MDLPMFCERNAFVIAAGQVHFLHMILMDSDSGAAMCLGRADLTGVHHAEPLNVANLDLAVK
jgi:Xaa-Pro dipeptidase